VTFRTTDALVSVTFPIADLRSFIDGADRRLRIPEWPAPLPGREFVRSFGPIERRRGGGVAAWNGESIICNAKSAIRFSSNVTCSLNHPNRSHYSALSEERPHGVRKIEVAFRRFNFDGLVSAKFESGFLAALKGTERLNANHLLTEILRAKIRRHDELKQQFSSLMSAGKGLAIAYCRSSTSHPSKLSHTPLVEAVEPVIIIEWSRHRIEIPKRATRVGVA